MARQAKKEHELDRELLKEVEALIDGKAEHVKSTNPFLKFCVRLLNIKPEVDKDFQESLRQRLVDRYQEFVLPAPASKAETLRARGIGFHEVVNKMKGGIGMLRSKKALAGAVAGVIMLIVGFVVFAPFGSQSPEVLAQEIAEQDPRIAAFLEEGGTFSEAVNVEETQGDFYRVTFELPGHPEKGQGQTIVNALVDLENARVVKVERGYIPPLTEEQKERAIEIAKSDSRVQEFLDRGATIYKVTSLPSFSSSLEERPETIMAGVALELEDEEVREKMFVEVNLTEESVVNVLKDEQELTVPPEKILTEEERARAGEIAEADPRVQEILQGGGTIVGVFPTIDEGIVDLAIIADHPKRSWTVKVDLEEGKVIEIKEDVMKVLGGTE